MAFLGRNPRVGATRWIGGERSVCSGLIPIGEFGANFDRQASATDSVSFPGLCPADACRSVSFFIPLHRGAT
jgi:hypothetical protein